MLISHVSKGYVSFECQYADIDECSEGTHNCDQVCTNTEGSFTCSCNSGFVLNEDGHSCIVKPTNLHVIVTAPPTEQSSTYINISTLQIIQYTYNYSSNPDVDECSSSSTNDCDHVCTNTEGSFTCSCNSGYTLSNDGRSCNGMHALHCM